MIEPSSRDFRRCRILSADPLAGGGVDLHIRLEHEDHDPACDWSWCELVVRLGPGWPVPPSGSIAQLVLASTVIEARDSEMAGVYSCKLQPATRQPTFGYERHRQGFYSGLIEFDAESEEVERGDLPVELLFHMGSGLSSYVTFADAEVVELEELIEEPWWEFRFEEPHRVLALELLEAPSDSTHQVEPASEGKQGKSGAASNPVGRLLRRIFPGRP